MEDLRDRRGIPVLRMRTAVANSGTYLAIYTSAGTSVAAESYTECPGHSHPLPGHGVECGNPCISSP